MHYNQNSLLKPAFPVILRIQSMSTPPRMHLYIQTLDLKDGGMCWYFEVDGHRIMQLWGKNKWL